MQTQLTDCRFVEIVRQNPVVETILTRLPDLQIPDCWLVSTCLTHSFWNWQDGFDPCRGIKDYDLFYFDSSDLSWQAEDRVIRRLAETFSDLDVDLELRNQARVHLWFESKTGIAGYPKLKCSKDGIDNFLGIVHMIGIAPSSEEKVEVYAPHGFNDLLSRQIRPNPKALGPASSYMEKGRRWQTFWPDLKLVPWPE